MSLTPRHLDVLRGLLNGKSDLEIARDLDLSINTVKCHGQAIYGYIGVHGRKGLLPLMVMVGSMQSPRFDISFDIPFDQDGKEHKDQGIWVVVPRSVSGPFLTQQDAQHECNTRNKAIGWTGCSIEECSHE